MGVLTLDAFTRQKFQGATRYYQPGQKINGRFKAFLLDANPLIYSSAMKAFEYGDYDTTIRQNDQLTYEQKIQLVFQYTWDEIFQLVQVVDCEEVFIAFDGVAPAAKCYQQRRRRYPRPAVSKNDFDATLISAGTDFMNDLCLFISYKLQKEWIKDHVKKVIFSGHTVAGEGEHKNLSYIRSLPQNSQVIMFGPDGDLILLGLLSNQDFYLFKVDHNTRSGYDKRYYTIRMKSIKPQIVKWSPGVHPIDATKAFVFLGSFLGNDFLPRLEIFEVFISGIDDLFKRYLDMKKQLIRQGRLDKNVFTDLLYLLARQEPQLLEQRTKHPFPLLEKHLVNGKLNFDNFRKEYYSSWLKAENEKEIAQICYGYLDTLWWTWIYYNKGCPQFSHYYKHLYPPFAVDLAHYSKQWKIPFFKKDNARPAFHQLVAILPRSRMNLLPQEYHHLFQGEDFPEPDSIHINTEGKGEFEYIYEIPFYTKPILVVDKEHYNRNEIGQDRVFTRGTTEYWVITKWGEFSTKIEG